MDIEDLKDDLGLMLQGFCTPEEAEAAFGDASSAVVARLKEDGYVRDAARDQSIDRDADGRIESRQFAFSKNGALLMVGFDHREQLYNASAYELFEQAAGDLVSRLDEIYALVRTNEHAIDAVGDAAPSADRMAARRTYIAATNITNVMRYELGLDLPEPAYVSRYFNQTVLVPDEIATFQADTNDTVEVNISGGVRTDAR